jgi:SOS response regulatory protein OraA/RecX
LSDRLKENSFDPQAIEMEMAYLSEEGWLDDQKSAGLILESLTEKNPTSRMFAEEKLKAKGFDEEVISTTLDHYYAQVDLPEMLKNMAIERRALLLKTHPDLSAQKQARRIANQIERRGFDEESVKTAISQAGFEIEEPISDA